MIFKPFLGPDHSDSYMNKRIGKYYSPILERLLLLLSRDPEEADYHSSEDEYTMENALSLLENEFPDFGRLVAGRRVVDFGCGLGYQSIALVKKYKCFVVGIDINQKTLAKAIKLAQFHNIPPSKLIFVHEVSKDLLNNFDIVVSQNSFEHFSNPLLTFKKMQSLLKNHGKILITFGPPWLAPYGSHMHFFCKVPWINILFPERTVMKVRSHFRADGATRYEDVESGLNKMTIAKFEHIISLSKMKIEFKNYKCVKGINQLSRIPFLREFFINRVSIILSKNI